MLLKFLNVVPSSFLTSTTPYVGDFFACVTLLALCTVLDGRIVVTYLASVSVSQPRDRLVLSANAHGISINQQHSEQKTS